MLTMTITINAKSWSGIENTLQEINRVYEDNELRYGQNGNEDEELEAIEN